VREQGAVAEARALLARAQTILAATPAGAIEREHARLQEAYILNEMGKHGQALGLVQKAAASYAALGDAKGTLEALLAEAAIHFEADDFELAQTVYEKALPLAKSVRNARGCALALGHLGHCAMRLGHTQRALAYFAEALPLYDTLGMSRNRRSILWEMARLAVREDRLADAFRQFASVREDFLRRGMFMSAAFVALDMAELLLEIGRAEGARQWCQELVQTFSSAGMPEYALQALRHLKDAAENDMLDVQVLGRVRADVCEHLHSYA
jgi:tetratricopeptide (TPR) repeat protein